MTDAFLPMPVRDYPARVIRVVDADTIDVTVDKGFNDRSDMKLRLYGIDAPELSTDAGKAARAFMRELLPPGTLIIVRTRKDKQEKYGRYLAEVWLGDVSVNERLVEAGHATPYYGGKR